MFGNTFKRVLATAVISPLLICCVAAESARAEWVRSLYAGQSDWVPVTLDRGDYTIAASTLWSLGDVDIELYDASRQTRIARTNAFGNDQMNITVHRGGTFYIKYSMPFCVNPAGACAVNIDVY